MNSNTKRKANIRLQNLLTSTKGNDKDKTKLKWDINKEYTLAYHDKSFSEVIINTNI
jgi:hypothetical protein